MTESNVDMYTDHFIRIEKLLEVCARELAINNQLKMVEDAREGMFNGNIEFNRFMNGLIAKDLNDINGGSDNV